MKKIFYSLIGLAILAGLFFVIYKKPVAVETARIKPGTFEETLATEGKVRSRTKQTIYAFATGNIESLRVKVGDAIRKDQVLTRLEWDNLLLVKSPIDGVVSKIYRESSGPILRGEPILEVSSLSDLEVVADLLTPDAIRLSPQGQARILNWGGENELPAQIHQISRAGVVKTSALGVEEERTEVRLSFEKIPEALKEKFGDNYHVDIVFYISREANALMVPLGALFKSGNNWTVFVVQDGKAQFQEIKISKRNDRYAVVTEGLQEGDQVILFPGDKIRPGTRVRAVP